MRVFISGPYTASKHGTEQENTDLAIDCGTWLKTCGNEPFIPHLSHYIEQRFHFSYDDWIKHCLAYLEVCDAIFMLPNWRNSKGACIEHQFAIDHGIKVWYTWFGGEGWNATNDEQGAVDL